MNERGYKCKIDIFSSGEEIQSLEQLYLSKIISIPESSRDEMFELTKKEFLRENGVLNGDATKRSDMYTNMYRKVAKEERLAAGNTLSQYERAY